MRDNNPTLLEYFIKIIPDESVFSYLLQQLHFNATSDIIAAGNGDIKGIPYFIYEPGAGNTIKSNLYRGFYRIDFKNDLNELPDIDEIFKFDGNKNAKVSTCGCIIRTDKDAILSNSVMYLAVECKPGKVLTLQNEILEKIDYCVGVGF